MLQSDLNILYDWYTNNNLTLNIKKCHIILTFSRAKGRPTNYNYVIDGEIIVRSTGPIKDLAILFDLKLKFGCHIKMIINCINYYVLLIVVVRYRSIYLKSIYCLLVTMIHL